MLGLNDIYHAATLIKPYIHRTPVLTCKSLDKITNANLFFKCENFQKVGAFKFRGACNAVLNALQTEELNSVATHSSGNHAAALALAAQINNIKAYIVMPSNSSPIKKKAVSGYGAKIICCGTKLEDREKELKKVIHRTNAFFIHPYDNEKIICGQGTAALELLEDHPNLNVLITPVGGGGLLSGSAIAARNLVKNIQIIGAEPEIADDACRSLKANKLIPAGPTKTICDGLLTSLGELNFQIIRKKVDKILTASESFILFAMKTIFERMKIVVEPSAAIGLAIILQHPSFFVGKNVGIILSGGNIKL